MCKTTSNHIAYIHKFYDSCAVLHSLQWCNCQNDRFTVSMIKDQSIHMDNKTNSVWACLGSKENKSKIIRKRSSVFKNYY